VTLIRCENILTVTEIDPLVAHLRAKRQLGTDEQVIEFTRVVEHEIAAQGAFRITTNAGIFVACCENREA
jgi:hypothetical protein